MPSIKRQNKADKPKRQRKRKSRTTEVSSSSESDSSDSEPTPKKKTIVKPKAKETAPLEKSQPEASSSDEDRTITPPPPSVPQITDARAEDAFTSFYLRQITTEFAEDLDKIRSAGDFNEKSLGLLIGALKQGCDSFDRHDRLSVGRALAAAKS